MEHFCFFVFNIIRSVVSILPIHLIICVYIKNNNASLKYNFTNSCGSIIIVFIFLDLLYIYKQILKQLPVILEPPSINYLLLKKENDFKERKIAYTLNGFLKYYIIIYYHTVLFANHATPFYAFIMQLFKF